MSLVITRRSAASIHRCLIKTWLTLKSFNAYSIKPFVFVFPKLVLDLNRKLVTPVSFCFSNNDLAQLGSISMSSFINDPLSLLGLIGVYSLEQTNHYLMKLKAKFSRFALVILILNWNPSLCDMKWFEIFNNSFSVGQYNTTFCKLS